MNINDLIGEKFTVNDREYTIKEITDNKDGTYGIIVCCSCVNKGVRGFAYTQLPYCEITKQDDTVNILALSAAPPSYYYLDA